MMIVTKTKCDGFLCLSSATRHNAVEKVTRVYPSGNTEIIPMCERCSTCAQEVWENLTITVI